MNFSLPYTCLDPPIKNILKRKINILSFAQSKAPLNLFARNDFFNYSKYFSSPAEEDNSQF